MVKNKEVIMSRRGENIYKRKDGRWEGRYIESYRSDGKAKYKSVYAHTYREVRLKLKNRAALKKINIVNVSVAEWTAHYLKLQKDKVKISTMKVYNRYLNNYIQPFFKSIGLYRLNKELLQAFVNSLSKLSPSTVKGIFSLLREALKLANKSNYIEPIWLDVELPKLKKHKINVFTKEEQKLIEKSLKFEGDSADIGILICLYTGLRIGEVCGLKWSDIDFISKTMTVNRTIQRMTIDNKSILKELPPKSETSHRRIPIPEFLLEKLKNVKSQNSVQYVLHTDFHAMDPRTFQYQYKKILERAGVRYANAHTLRHTFSVRALEVGFDIKTLSEILGHADAAVTLKIYAHSLEEHKRNSMERLGNMRC
jgi:integrase